MDLFGGIREYFFGEVDGVGKVPDVAAVDAGEVDALGRGLH